MAFKLTKKEIETRDEHIAALREALGKLEDAVSEYNAALEALHQPVEAALEAYNGVLADARGFCEDIAGQAESDFDEKSEKWQEGERGQAASAFRDEWQGLSLEDVEVEFPGELEIETPTHADDIEAASEAADA